METYKAKLLVQRVRAGIQMLQQIEQDLIECLGEEALPDPIPQIEEVYLGDDGKEYKNEMPYLKVGKWYCCGRPLVKGKKDGKDVLHCERCNSNYTA